MASEKKAPIEKDLMSVDDFLAGVEADELLKHMFRHFYVVVRGITNGSKETLSDLFTIFKDMPASELN